MKNNFVNQLSRATLALLLVCSFQIMAISQSTKVAINGNDVGTWFGQNWGWVISIIIFLLVFLLLGNGNSSTIQKTTILRNSKGEVTQTEITKTEVE